MPPAVSALLSAKNEKKKTFNVKSIPLRPWHIQCHVWCHSMCTTAQPVCHNYPPFLKGVAYIVCEELLIIKFNYKCSGYRPKSINHKRLMRGFNSIRPSLTLQLKFRQYTNNFLFNNWHASHYLLVRLLCWCGKSFRFIRHVL